MAPTMATTKKMFSPFQSLNLKNRVCMGPMTRSRTTLPGEVPNRLMAEYYSQRASCGLIIAEGTVISPVARGYAGTPGIFTKEQIEGWKLVTKAVHDKGGKIFVQLWHCGRRSHECVAGEQTIVSASNIKEPDTIYGPTSDGTNGMIETTQPRGLSVEEIKQTTQDFVQAAKNAIEAGFDGVEVHGAHGYLFSQFMNRQSNDRTDQYGGSVENKARFLVETIVAVAKAVGASKTAFRISPTVLEGFRYFDPETIPVTYEVLKQVQPLKLAYCHLSENLERSVEVPRDYRQKIREAYKDNVIMICGKLDKKQALDHLEAGNADLVCFATPFITNPDLVSRMEHDWPLTGFDPDARLTLYGGGAKGYTDFLTYEEQQKQAKQTDSAAVGGQSPECPAVGG